MGNLEELKPLPLASNRSEPVSKPLECDCGNNSDFYIKIVPWFKYIECGECGKRLLKVKWMCEQI